MICSQDRWNQVFRYFTDEERQEIFRHKTCQTRSTFVLDDSQLSTDLRKKLKFNFEKGRGNDPRRTQSAP